MKKVDDIRHDERRDDRTDRKAGQVRVDVKDKTIYNLDRVENGTKGVW